MQKTSGLLKIFFLVCLCFALLSLEASLSVTLWIPALGDSETRYTECGPGRWWLWCVRQVSGHIRTRCHSVLSRSLPTPSCVSHRSQDPTEPLLPGSGLVSGLVSPNHSAPITGDDREPRPSHESHIKTNFYLIIIGSLKQVLLEKDDKIIFDNLSVKVFEKVLD